MNIITTTKGLEKACDDLLQNPYMAVDTEFMRETVYWPQLCLIQAAGGPTEVIIDPLADGLDLEPFWELMADERIIKKQGGLRVLDEDRVGVPGREGLGGGRGL